MYVSKMSDAECFVRKRAIKAMSSVFLALLTIMALNECIARFWMIVSYHTGLSGNATKETTRTCGYFKTKDEILILSFLRFAMIFC